jgi:DNA-binding CsgD family transcriptional regulator
VAERAPGVPLICAIETAQGVLAAAEIATADGVRHLSMGGVDLRRELNAGDGNLQTLYIRSHLVLVSRAAAIDPPIDSVYPHSATTRACASKRPSPARSASLASRRSTRAGCPPSTTSSRPPTRSSSGLDRCSTRSMARAAKQFSSTTASSSTRPSPSALTACWSSPTPWNVPIPPSSLDAFAERARKELQATGVKVRKRTVEARDDLTAQERQIARLARDRLSNPEIGARLFLSPRTVEWHLRKVFTKLGIRSRREMSQALASSDSELT